MTNEELHLIKRALAAINTVGHLAQNDFNQFPGVSGFLCLGRLFQGQPNEAALCI